MIRYETFILLPVYQTNTYLVFDDLSGDTMLIDPAAPSQAVCEYIKKHNLSVRYLINTHGHADHIGGNAFFQECTKAPILIHRNDAGMLLDAKQNLSSYLEFNLLSPAAEKTLSDGDILKLGAFSFRTIHTPGHTPGSICIYGEGLLFSGDTLFCGDHGRTDLPGGNQRQIVQSIKDKLFILPDETLVLPGHEESSTVGREKISQRL